MRNRKGIIVLGGQRCGKSWYLAQLALAYQKGGASTFVYNLGKLTDFPSCDFAKLLDYTEHEDYIREKYGDRELKRWKRTKEFRYIEYDGEIFHIKYFNRKFRGKGIKVTRLEKSFEAKFFNSFYKYISNCLLIFDDSKAFFSPNLTEYQHKFASSMNHCGSHHIDHKYKKAGVDCAFVFHALDQIPEQLLSYYTDDYIFTCLKYKQQPNFKRITDLELREFLEYAFKELQTLPKYTKLSFSSGKVLK